MSTEDAARRVALAEEALVRLRGFRAPGTTVSTDPLTRIAEAEEEVVRLSVENVRREDELADRERTATPRDNYELTAFPEIFKSTYWGNQHGASAVICRNRNLFTSVYEIKAQHNNQVVVGYASYGRNGRFRKFFDHAEMYRTHDDRFALVLSPYNYAIGMSAFGDNRYNVADFISACGFTVIQPIYQEHAMSMVKIGGVKDFIDYRVVQR